MKLPREIDELMWALAESQDEAALDDFARRYPTYKAEMARRLRALRALRSARPTVPAGLFVPSRGGSPQTGGRRWVPLLAATVIAGTALAGGAFVALNFVQPEVKIDPGPEASGKPLKIGSQVLAESGITTPLPDTDSAECETDKVAPPKPEEPALPTIVSVRVTKIRLTAVIGEIARQGGYTFEIAPGLEDPLIDAEYTGVSAIEALTDLGQNFGFTPFAQTDRSVLIIPALDQNARPVEVKGHGFSRPTTHR